MAWKKIGLLVIGLALPLVGFGQEDDLFNSGPIYDRYSLTLEPGNREEWLGPLYFHEIKGETTTWGFPPLLTWSEDKGTDSAELDIVYPLLSYDRFGTETRWQLFQWLNFSGNRSIDESDKKRFTLFPIYFQQRSQNPTNNYTAVIPFYGNLKNRFFRDEVHFVLMPLYVQSRKRDVITDNYVYPFFHWRHGNGLKGWQFWPMVGNENKEITQKTDDWGDVTQVPGHKSFFFAWPFFLKQRAGIGTTNEQRSLAVIPLFSAEHSAVRDSVSFPWLIGFTRTEDREKQYREFDAPWPFVVFARGPGKTANRIWPVFSKARTKEVETGFYAWPLYKYTKVDAFPLKQNHWHILFYLYSDLSQLHQETKEEFHRRNFWPLFTYRKEFDNRERLQVLALLEPFLPASHSVERDYSPVWSLWRSEKNPKTGSSSQSLLWNLYRHEVTPEKKKSSLLFGLFQYQTGVEGRKLRLFYIPMGTKKAASKPSEHANHDVAPPPH